MEFVKNYPKTCLYNRGQRVDDVLNCKYGWDDTTCGFYICKKGPGDVCGGKYDMYGICGVGTMCSNCNRCQGISMLTFERFDDPICITK